MDNPMNMYLNTLHQLYNAAYGIEFPAGIEEDVPPTPTNKYLCFTANTANSTIGMTHYGTNATTTQPTIYISTDGRNFSEWDYSTITLVNQGDKVWMYGDNPNGLTYNSTIYSVQNYSSFTMTGSIGAYGDVTTLITAQGTTDLSEASYCFYKLFYGCTSLTTTPELPATVLSSFCYEYMFGGCTSITVAPELPATIAEDGCYSNMFRECTSLTTAPELPATTAGNYCYQGMFYGCTSLTTAPELPATTAKNYCYYSMFNGCTSLVTAPTVLPAVMTGRDNYSYMFKGCTSLVTAPILPSTTTTQGCYEQMFNGCRSLKSITCLASSIDYLSTNNWIVGVSDSGTFAKAADMNDWATGASGIPSGWTVINYEG